MPRANPYMQKAKAEKNDEFYTMYEDIEKEIINYKEQLKDKTIYCNCDDPEKSNFWKYFYNNFNKLNLKKLISTHYVKGGCSYALIYDGKEETKEPLIKHQQNDLFDICEQGADGDFRSEECIEYLKKADIVITNPPFSLFQEFVTQLIEYDKKFLILGNMNSICYMSSYIKENKLWTGYGFNKFLIFKAPYKNVEEANRKYVMSQGLNPDDGYVKVPAITWFTNLDTTKKHKEFVMTKEYNKDDYLVYDNYNAINVDNIEDIPCDYYEYMGVPISFMEYYNPEQFEIIGITYCKDKNSDIESIRTDTTGKAQYRHTPILNGKSLYYRIIIKRKV